MSLDARVETDPEMRGQRSLLGLLRTAVPIAAVAGAVGSIGFMLYAGRHNHSVILLALFTGWVLAPFVALLWANTRAMLRGVTVAVALGSLAVYGYDAWRPPAKAAAAFLMVPLASWVAIAIAAAVTRRRS